MTLSFKFPSVLPIYSRIWRLSIRFDNNQIMIIKNSYYIFVGIQQMMKVWSRFMDWIFHPSIRRDPLIRGKAYQYRYPSPGNILKQKHPEDYKTPFQDSTYNVRYAHPTSLQTAQRQSQVKVPGAHLSPIQKLVLLKYLNESDKDNKTAVEEARKKFKSVYGFEVENEIYKNDLGLQFPNKADRQSYRKFISKNYVSNTVSSKEQQLISQEQLANHPDIIQFQSLDLYDSPHFMQGRIENDYLNDKIQNLRANEAHKHGGLRVRQGSANYWKALDDSNDPKNIRKVQGKIGDPTPLDYALRNAKVKFEFDKQDKVVGIQRIPDSK